MNNDHVVLVLLCLGIAGYLSAFGVLLSGRRRLGLALMGGGWCVNVSLLVFNGIVAGHPPFGNMYHVLTFLSVCFLPLYAFLVFRHRLGWLDVYFALMSALPLIGPLFMKRDVEWSRMPALQSPWFVPHVVAYMISYSLAAAAFAVTVVKWLRRRAPERAGTPDDGQAVYSMLRLAFPFMTFGLLSGAVWADQAWGVYWSWDRKETWSLITWILYVVYFHCRRSGTMRRLAEPAQVLAFLALLTTFLLVNLLPRLSSILHSYAPIE